MKAHLKTINDNFSDIRDDVNKLLKEKYNLSAVHVSEIHFAETPDCPPGYEPACQYFGKDPKTGKPIVKCTCVPKMS